MTDQERFTQAMAEMMGLEFVSSVISPCLYIKKKDGSCFPAINEHGELTPECRKWWVENLPEAYDLYCADVYEQGYGRDLQAKYQYIELVRATLDWRNLWNWMLENVDSWLYEDCPKCHGTEFSNVEHVGRFICDLCNGTGRIARWELGELMKKENKEKVNP